MTDGAQHQNCQENQPLKRNRRICFVVATEITVTAFLIDQIRAAAAHYEVWLALKTENVNFLVPYGIAATVVPIAIERKISPLADLAALYFLYRLFRKQRFDLIHSVSPKAGLLAMMAGFFAHSGRRLHVFTGQVWATRSGMARYGLKWIDRLLAALATHLLVDSRSQRDFLVAEAVLNPRKATVLANGSISGVDPARFRPDEKSRADVRRELGISEQDIVFLFLGRLNRDKGVHDLALAFAQMCKQRANTWLVMVGPDEGKMKRRVSEICRECSNRVRMVDYTTQPERYMAAADVFCLPSYREGFGTVVIEAATCAVPAIASRIYGLTDAVVDGMTGVLHEAGDVAALAKEMTKFADDPLRRLSLGAAARRRALADFSMTGLTAALLDYYEKILG